MVGTTVSRYRILAPLGGGGMGVVYEAEDPELGRRVAVKLLPEATSRSPEAIERFRREARAASALNHPHICTVYDAGVHEGQPFLVMERMQGRTLKHEIEGRTLPIERVLVLGAEIADALDAAHRAGIVHRDLKPTNLFVTDHGELKVLDFGLAKLISGEGDSAVTADGTTVLERHLTDSGATVGTVAYMSPEQARGEHLDARSDLFSLGVVLYEMATGCLPFPGESPAELFAAILTREPIPPAQIHAAIPAKLEDAILKCLEKDPALRYQSASGVLADFKRLLRDQGIASGAGARPSLPLDEEPSKTSLKRRAPGPRLGIAVVLGAATVAAASVGLWLWRGPDVGGRSDTAGTRAAAEKRIAVLPFENLGAAEDAYFAEGMTDEVRSKLAGLPGLAVIARGSCNAYRGTAKPPPVIAKELGVSYLLTATVRWQKSGTTSRIRVLPELVEILGGSAPSTRWQETFDAELADVFEVQANIASQVVHALKLAIGAAQTERLQTQLTSNIAAYDAYLRGRQIFDRGFQVAIQQQAAAEFERAVALDPQFSQAWARLAMARSMTYANGLHSPELDAAAREAAERSMALAPGLAEPYYALGVYHRTVSNETEQAIEIFRQGLAVAPDNVDLLRNLGYAESERGRLEEALAATQRAAALDPRSWQSQLAVTDSLLLLRRPREAREAADRALALNPSNVSIYEYKAKSYLQEGDLVGARAMAAAVPPEVDPTALVASYAFFNITWALDDERRELLLRLTPAAFGDSETEWATALVTAHWLRGDRDEARRYAEKAQQSFRDLIAKNPQDVDAHLGLSLALATLGRVEEAVREVEKGLELSSKEPVGYQEDSVRYLAYVYARLGRQEPAIDALERLLGMPSRVTPGWLRVDPYFDSLRGNPRFDKLAAGQP